MKVNILGTDCKIIKKKYEDYPRFKENSIDGEFLPFENKIVVCDMHTFPSFDFYSEKAIKRMENETLRHELLHAFLCLSGLSSSASMYGGAWCENEEMVDWFALQIPKIYKVYEELGILE